MRCFPLLLCLAACLEPPSDRSAPHNVLVVLLDDVGLDKLAAFDAHPEPPYTPNLNALAAQSVRFQNAYTYAVCSPSRAALLTGRYGRRTGIGTNLHVAKNDAELPYDELTLPEMLRASPAAHYTTAAVGKWHLSTHVDHDFLISPNRHGFDWFDGNLWASPSMTWDQSCDKVHDYYHWERVRNGRISHVDTYATTAQIDAAIERVTAMPEPWFLYLSTYAGHGPLHVPPAHLQSTGVTEEAAEPAQYAAMLEALDTELGRLLASVPERTTIIVAGDNGTARHNILSPWDSERGKATHYEAGIRVPLFVSGPLVDEPGGSEALVHLVDIFATAADIAQVDPTSLDRVIDGQSLVPYLRDPATPWSRTVLYTEHFGSLGPPPYKNDVRILRDERYKLVHDAINEIDTFYELDPGTVDEGSDLLGGGLSAEQEQRYERLRTALTDQMATFEDDHAEPSE